MPPVRGGTYCGVVYNGIDVESFPYEEQKEDYLLFLGCMAPVKGTHLAIEAARCLGKRLIIAAKVDRADRQYFRDVVEPLIDGDLIQFVGEVDGTLKRRLYARACCLLVPICWEEPFGLVMVEAMACGTPVIAFARGAATELVVDGETGFLVHDIDGMVRAVHRVDRIDPQRCRRHVEENFSVQRMTEGYLAVYERILEEAAIGERLIVVGPGLGGEENPLLTEVSQLAEAAASRQDEGPTDEELAVP
jgi:glycosyltransferase involved in cell wall biosynthesis